MIHSIALSPDELREVTGYRAVGKQIHALVLMEIPFKVRPNGSPFVARADIEGPVVRPDNDKQEAVLTLI